MKTSLDIQRKKIPNEKSILKCKNFTSKIIDNFSFQLLKMHNV